MGTLEDASKVARTYGTHDCRVLHVRFDDGLWQLFQPQSLCPARWEGGPPF